MKRMKKFWLVLLSLGLIMAFSVSAFAVDVKVSGEYYAAGLYLDKNNLKDNNTSDSTAFFFQRLRVGTDFVVSPCLKLVTRFDAMERIWGGQRSPSTGTSDMYSAGTRDENENIAVDLVYIDYTSPIGQFKVGYQPNIAWGTVFADTANGEPAGQIQYWKSFGPATLFVGYAKEGDNSFSAVNTSANWTDRDRDSYRLGGIYKFNVGEAGALLIWNRDATNRDNFDNNTPPNPEGYLQNVYVINPYVKAKIGPVALQAELQYYFGDAAKWEDNVHQSDVDIDALSVFVDAAAKFGMFYVGGSFAYLSGDDPDTDDKIEGSTNWMAVNHAGLDWDPCLIMFNTQTARYWVGQLNGHDIDNNSAIDEAMSNAWFGQLRAGVNPTPQWDIMLSVSYAVADQKPAGYHNDDYGTEIDLTATYKITNNLSYMLGGGYLFTGDYFKGTNNAHEVDNDFILINKLTLTF